MKLLILSNDKEMPFLMDVVEHMGIHATFNPSSDYDRGVSFMHLKKITKAQLAKPWINFHPGPLPRYKGRNLCYHAILDGATSFGASVHYMDENYDAGEIIDVMTFPVLPYYTAGDLSMLAMSTAYALLDKYLPRFAAGENFESIKNFGGVYHFKEKICDMLEVDDVLRKQIRAITCGEHHPKINIGGKVYKVVPE